MQYDKARPKMCRWRKLNIWLSNFLSRKCQWSEGTSSMIWTAASSFRNVDSSLSWKMNRRPVALEVGANKDTKQTRDMSDRSTVYFYSRLWSLMTFTLCGCWLQVQFCHRFLAVKRKFFLFTVTKRLLTAGAAVFLSEVYFSSGTHFCTYCFHSVFFPAKSVLWVTKTSASVRVCVSLQVFSIRLNQQRNAETGP